MSDIPRNGDSFWRRITPGSWLTLGLVLVTAVASWTKMDNGLTVQAAAVTELKAAISRLATVDALTNVARDTDKDMASLRAMFEANRSDFKITVDALTARLSVLGERTNDTSREAAQLSTEITNIKDMITELRRQARNSDPARVPAISSFGPR